MEEDIENALNNLWNSLDDESFNLTYSQEQMQEDLRLILNRYNYLDSKVENLINKYKEQQKMIELMADELSLFNAMDCDYRDYKGHECIRQDDFDGKYDRRKCKNCIIDYFRKKAKGE